MRLTLPSTMTETTPCACTSVMETSGVAHVLALFSPLSASRLRLSRSLGVAHVLALLSHVEHVDPVPHSR